MQVSKFQKNQRFIVVLPKMLNGGAWVFKVAPTLMVHIMSGFGASVLAS